MDLIIAGQPDGNLIALEAQVSIENLELPSRRPGISYALVARCPVCQHKHRAQSPLWHLVDKVTPDRGMDLGNGHVIYHMVIQPPEGPRELIAWATRHNVGHESKRFIEGTWRCDCGIVFGLTSNDIAYLLREITRQITFAWTNRMIMQKESELRPDVSVPVRLTKRYWYMSTN